MSFAAQVTARYAKSKTERLGFPKGNVKSLQVVQLRCSDQRQSRRGKVRSANATTPDSRRSVMTALLASGVICKETNWKACSIWNPLKVSRRGGSVFFRPTSRASSLNTHLSS